MILHLMIFIETVLSESNKCQTGELIIPSNTKIIENNEYEGCHEFTGSLIIPNSVVKISKYAFYGCSGLNGNLIISENVKEIGDYAFSETNFESIDFMVEHINCSSNSFTNVPKKITVKDNYKEDYICGFQIREPESKSWFKKNITLILCIAIPVIIIVIIVIVASCMKNTSNEKKTERVNPYDLSSIETISETQTQNHSNTCTSSVREKNIVNNYNYNKPTPSSYWSCDEKKLSDNELSESISSISNNVSQINSNNNYQSTEEESSPMSIHESSSCSSLCSNPIKQKIGERSRPLSEEDIV